LIKIHTFLIHESQGNISIIFIYIIEIERLMFIDLLIDKVQGVLELDRAPEGTARYAALDKWTVQLNNLQKLVINKML